MTTIRKIITSIYEDEELRETCIPLFLSPPGIGKTKIIRRFAEEKGVKLLPFIASQRMPHELSGTAMPDHSVKRMTYFNYDMFLDLKDGDVRFFDEILNANSTILNACLTILENRELISGKKLPKVMIVAAANPHGSAVLTPQIKERFIWYDMPFDSEGWKEELAKYQITNDIFRQLEQLVYEEQFGPAKYNYNSARSLEKALKMMLKGAYTPYETKLAPILNTLIENTTGKDIDINGYTYRAGEQLPWLKLRRMMNGYKDEII